MELKNEPAIRENDSDAETTASTGVIFTTILLLIGGLLLTSAMLFYYGLKGAGENAESISGLTQIWELATSKPTQAQTKPEIDTLPVATTTPDAEAKPAGISFKNIFSKEGTGSVRWPRLKLAGFGLPSDGEVGFAIINGKQIIEGNTIGDVTLVEILDHGVIVEYKGETKTLIVEMIH